MAHQAGLSFWLLALEGGGGGWACATRALRLTGLVRTPAMSEGCPWFNSHSGQFGGFFFSISLHLVSGRILTCQSLLTLSDSR